MSEIEKINNDLVVDDMVYRPTSTLPNQNIEGHLCINYNGKVLEFKDKDYANYVYNLRKLLKECFNAINQGSYCDRCEMLHKISKVLGEE